MYALSLGKPQPARASTAAPAARASMFDGSDLASERARVREEIVRISASLEAQAMAIEQSVIAMVGEYAALNAYYEQEQEIARMMGETFSDFSVAMPKMTDFVELYYDQFSR